MIFPTKEYSWIFNLKIYQVQELNCKILRIEHKSLSGLIIMVYNESTNNKQKQN